MRITTRKTAASALAVAAAITLAACSAPAEEATSTDGDERERVSLTVGYIDTIISVPKKGKRACVDDQVHAIMESRLKFETLKHRLTEVSR